MTSACSGHRRASFVLANDPSLEFGQFREVGQYVVQHDQRVWNLNGSHGSERSMFLVGLIMNGPQTVWSSGSESLTI